MFDSMYEAEGIGLAANQVGLNMHLFIIDVTHTDEVEDTHIFINSKIISRSGEKHFFRKVVYLFQVLPLMLRDLKK